MKVTASTVSRLAGLAAMAGGALFVAVQPLHPADVLASVSTGTWAIVHYLGVAMSLLILIGITGMYARQVEESGWLGLVAYLVISCFWVLTAAWQFVEAFISPVLATEAPAFVEGILGMVAGDPSEISLGSIPTAWLVTGLLYVVGGLLFGLATFRAAVLPRRAAALLSFAAVAPLALSTWFPHPYDRILAVPMGLSLAWLGYALWSERREPLSQSVAGTGSAQLRQSGAG